MSASEDERKDVITKALNRTLAPDDPGWQNVKSGREKNVPQDVAAYDEAMSYGGPVSGASVRKAI